MFWNSNFTFEFEFCKCNPVRQWNLCSGLGASALAESYFPPLPASQGWFWLPNPFSLVSQAPLASCSRPWHMTTDACHQSNDQVRWQGWQWESYILPWPSASPSKSWAGLASTALRQMIGGDVGGRASLLLMPNSGTRHFPKQQLPSFGATNPPRGGFMGGEADFPTPARIEHPGSPAVGRRRIPTACPYWVAGQAPQAPMRVFSHPRGSPQPRNWNINIRQNHQEGLRETMKERKKVYIFELIKSLFKLLFK